MLTPAFELKQDDIFLTIFIKTPFAKISETEIFIDDSDFKFYSKPYFLRLSLPGNLVEDGREKADYDADKGAFTIKVPKQTQGEEFEGLDMLTKLLAPKGNHRATAPLIEVIDDKEHISTVDTPPEDDTDEVVETDWSFQQVPVQQEDSVLKTAVYGFANQKSGIFQNLQSELCDIVDVVDPDGTDNAERRERRVAEENQKFDEDYYIADLYEDEGVQQVLLFIPSWVEELTTVQKGGPVDFAVVLTDDEKEKMRRLPRKEYVLSQTEESGVFLGLLDILLAYCYNHRTTEGENNVESGWTISKQSATLSWLQTFSSIEDVVQTSFRRCLCYPLYRHWQLNQTILQDVKTIFSLGRRKLLQCLLEVHTLLIDTDARYVLNDLYVTDYCVWIQSVSDKKIKSFFDALQKLKVSKSDVEFDLDEIERISRLAFENAEVEEATSKLNKVSLTEAKGRDSDDDSTDTDDENTCDSDTTTESDDESTDNDSDDDNDSKDLIQIKSCPSSISSPDKKSSHEEAGCKIQEI